MDQNTRDYFFALFKSASPIAKDYILTNIFGYLEGMLTYYGEGEHLMFLMEKIQHETDIDFGIVE